MSKTKPTHSFLEETCEARETKIISFQSQERNTMYLQKEKPVSPLHKQHETCETNTDLMTCLDHFVSLVSHTKIQRETPFSQEESPLSHVSPAKNIGVVKFSENHLVFDWLTIVLEEGHIEPSQPTVGRLIGWPQRKFFVESLYVDFIVWNRKQGRYECDIPNLTDFASILNKIFIHTGDFYTFPPLETCRAKFQTLRRQYEPA